MGWLWSSSSGRPQSDTQSSPTGDEAGQKQNKIALTDEQRLRIFGRTGNLQSSCEEQADAELDAFLKSFGAAESHGAAPEREEDSSKATPSEKVNVTEARSSRNRLLPDGALDISPSAMYPRTMSCRQAFDQAFYCQSLGGKFNDIYRFGHLQSCSEQWSAFWFCMRTRTLPDKDKEEQIMNHYAGREERKRKDFGSSEDVWEIRPVAVKRAFWKDPDTDDDGSGVRTTS